MKNFSANYLCKNQGPLNGGVSRSGRVLPFLSFFVLLGPFPICFSGFSRFVRGTPGIFPVVLFLFLGLLLINNSTHEEQSRKGPRHTLDLSRRKWETPRFGNPPGLASPKISSAWVYAKFGELFVVLFLFLKSNATKCSQNPCSLGTVFKKLKYVQSDSVPSRLQPNSCLLNAGRGPKSNRTSRLLPGSF